MTRAVRSEGFVVRGWDVERGSDTSVDEASGRGSDTPGVGVGGGVFLVVVHFPVSWWGGSKSRGLAMRRRTLGW